ncbi:4745_t:CDS:2 [Ambispora gerdemannii]|uniref:4745_t:CDS:1 n=1 Tax=Ambispora gerdemannii TaxID=144530 RepID=A0A9N8ZKN7_9GLOM|nr:4745_t:CDS:2 [Ambispora gerdemannii]
MSEMIKNGSEKCEQSIKQGSSFKDIENFVTVQDSIKIAIDLTV